MEPDSESQVSRLEVRFGFRRGFICGLGAGAASSRGIRLTVPGEGLQ